MREIRLESENSFTCPVCSSGRTEMRSYIFCGMSVLAECECRSCLRTFYHTYPIGHAFYFPVSFTKEGDVESYVKKSKNWFSKPLIQNFFSSENVNASIEKIISTERPDVVILNCLDNCYCHSIYKLLNADYYLEKRKDQGLVIIVPKALFWMIPDGVSEVWVVDLPFRLLNKKIYGFDRFVKEEIRKFRSVSFSPSFLHHDFSSINLKRFTRLEGFDLAKFSKAPVVVTFVFREDRLWHTNAYTSFLWKVIMKLKLKPYFNSFFIRWQNQLINRTASLISKEIKEVIFYAVGMGKTGRLNPFITDLRTDQSVDNQKEWCKTYAKSHLIIGMHGSNMFLPTGLAAGFIELLPRDRIMNYMEDIFMNKPLVFANFLSRFLDIYSSPQLVAKHAIEIVEGFPQIYSESFIKP